MKQILSILIILLVLGVLAVVFGGLQRDQEPAQHDTVADDQSFVPPLQGRPAPTAYSLSGTLLSIQGEILRFGANVERTEEGKQLVEEKAVRVTSSTQVVRFETVTGMDGRPRVEERQMSLSDLDPGDRIQVISSRDVFQQEEILATKIRFLGGE